MKPSIHRAGRSHRGLSTVFAAAVLAVSLAGIAAAPAFAEDRHHDPHDEHRNVPVRHEPEHHDKPYYHYHGPAYVSAPPPVFYAPPQPTINLDFVFPLN